MDNNYILHMTGISKEFPGVKALNNVDFDLKKGEVHALVGENGAGKSTLIKILAGVHRADEGKIWLRGKRITAHGTKAMIDAGISVIYQELNLIPYLTVAENIFLGREPLKDKAKLIHWKMMYARVKEILQPFSIDLDPKAKVYTLGIAYQQIVEIAKALSLESDVIVMDEPTATLTGHETEHLFEIIDTLKEKGVSIIYISHRLEEIRRIADRVTVLRDGGKIITDELKNLRIEDIIKFMVGREVTEKYPKEEIPAGDELLRVENLSKEGVCKDISFNLRKGEILGIAGLVGAGRTEMAQVLFGHQKKGSGKITIKGKEVPIKKPADAVREGLGLIPEERKNQGLVLGLSVFDNISLAILDRVSSSGFIHGKSLGGIVDGMIQKIGVKTPSTKQLVKNLSGGNQQKVVLAKWFSRNCDIYIFDEPTRGIDVGAKIEIYRLMESLAREGAGILMISSELPEVLNMSDRILVMYNGQIVKEFSKEEATQEAILSYAIGGGEDSMKYAKGLLGEEV
ncbi:MAG: sugar ABC transporter ATP-binding protein [bacterium]|nr:sugar ABC transporter ATP-binding protein [bacterium]